MGKKLVLLCLPRNNYIHIFTKLRSHFRRKWKPCSPCHCSSSGIPAAQSAWLGLEISLERDQPYPMTFVKSTLCLVNLASRSPAAGAIALFPLGIPAPTAILPKACPELGSCSRHSFPASGGASSLEQAGPAACSIVLLLPFFSCSGLFQVKSFFVVSSKKALHSHRKNESAEFLVIQIWTVFC